VFLEARKGTVETSSIAAFLRELTGMGLAQVERLRRPMPSSGDRGDGAGRQGNGVRRPGRTARLEAVFIEHQSRERRKRARFHQCAPDIVGAERTGSPEPFDQLQEQIAAVAFLAAVE